MKIVKIEHLRSLSYRKELTLLVQLRSRLRLGVQGEARRRGVNRKLKKLSHSHLSSLSHFGLILP